MKNQKSKYYKIQLILKTLLLGVLVGNVFVACSPESHGMSFQKLILSSLILSVYVIPNVIYILVLSYLKAFQNKIGWRFILIETLMLFAFFYVVDWSVKQLPNELRFYKTSKAFSEKLYFSFEFELIYAFILVSLCLWVFQLLKKRFV